ncbi:hypothetical protein NP603_06165 [Methylomonas sp. SURF-1]|uniref:Multidrug transporter n=1 Tax=Methylomonas aurea TaxID=2952224 RepID=A0ABT1UEM5_9GAMM|nr:hypothetical protein [Methylomonas sp. SURF-1]MCQ8180683.1 hypothetical protein [Methylomonas sp. SURF-1]
MRSVFVLVCLLSCLSLSASAATTDDDDAPAPRKNVPVPARPAGDTLTLDAAGQELAGIRSTPVKAARRQPEITAYGSVLNPEPLLAVRQQFLAASAQQAGARSRFSEAEHNLNRTRDLHRQDIVSTRRLQEQQAIRDADQANLAANSYQQQLIAANSRLTWGDTLTEWFTRPQHKAAAELLEHRAQLLQITLPAGSRLEPGIVRIQVDPAGQRQSALSAELISAAPQADPVTLGQRYFFKCGECRWPLGAHVTAWLPSGPAGESGVDLPQSALVWHMGQAWVFVKTDATHFSRRPLAAHAANGANYFVAEGLHPGEEIVTAGAQTLLSQMLKAQIPEEDDD